MGPLLASLVIPVPLMIKSLLSVLITSSSEVYGKGARVPFAEDDDVVMGPTRTTRWCRASHSGLARNRSIVLHLQALRRAPGRWAENRPRRHENHSASDR